MFQSCWQRGKNTWKRFFFFCFERKLLTGVRRRVTVFFELLREIFQKRETCRVNDFIVTDNIFTRCEFHYFLPTDRTVRLFVAGLGKVTNLSDTMFAFLRYSFFVHLRCTVHIYGKHGMHLVQLILVTRNVRDET